MASQTDLVLNDGQTTPVARTFSARGASMDLSKWIDISGGINIGMPMITLSNVTSGKNNDAAWRNEWRVVLPVLETVSGSDGGYTPQPKVAYNMFAKVELVAPNRSLLQSRKDLLAYVKNLLGTTVATGAFTTMDVPT